ncbi:MAG: sigma 54-interacting transcriptional regulator [Firmicutes bacterium]|nr:sigma 54-interacting transcriptional regulator [Candidatus Fermentithermobacillaceae bacterium]
MAGSEDIKRIRFSGAENRVGMIYDILRALGKQHINVLNIEVSPPDIFFKVEWPDDIGWSRFVNGLRSEISDLGHIAEVDIMEYEKKEKALDIIGENISEGILVVDQWHNITYASKKARKLLGFGPSQQPPNLVSLMQSRKLEPLLPLDEDRDNVEVTITWQGKSIRVVTSIRTITNEEGIPSGALVILRELDDVRQLIQSVRPPALVDFYDIIGRSQALGNAINLAKAVAPTNMSVMLRGESGTGKELFARAIHKNSARKNGPFIAVNCAAIPDSLLESEFFGYDRGAFTGASSGGKQGLFELATHGTLFLDEVGDLSPPLQAKILRAIQEQRIRRIGGRHEVKIDVRIISATNKDLESMISEGTFREDLFYRLNVIPIWIPPLRHRTEDIPLLAEHFVSFLARELGKPDLHLTESAMEKLLLHDWPGNVRELQNVIQRAAVLAEHRIEPAHLLIEGPASRAHDAPPGFMRQATVERNGTSVPEETRRQDAQDDDNRHVQLPAEIPVSLPGLIEEIEKYYLTKAASKYSSSRKIAKALGISHATVINKMKQLGIG